MFSLSYESLKNLAEMPNNYVRKTTKKKTNKKNITIVLCLKPYPTIWI